MDLTELRYSVELTQDQDHRCSPERQLVAKNRSHTCGSWCKKFS